MKLEKKIDSKDLVSQLNSLDLDDGVRIVGKKKKMFINKAALNEFVMQIKDVQWKRSNILSQISF